jgi:monovalent cation:H+ antiporter-2, CPA2 family
MAAAVDPLIFKDALIILGAAALVIPLFHRLKLSPVLGFILIGMAVGPFGLGAFAADQPWLTYVTIHERANIALMAELGIVVLLFMIGLEMSFERMMLLRKLVFGMGALQLGISSGLIAVVAWSLGQSRSAAVVIGLALALSSTAIITQLLADEKRLHMAVGRVSFAVLLLQDVAVVPILFAISMMGAKNGEASAISFFLAIAQAVFAVSMLIVFGRYALRPLFRSVARTNSPELFMAACLLVIIGASLATAMAGLSMAMGALLAGLLLAETEYRRQIEILVEPFKGLLLGVFLISVGMSVDLQKLVAAPLLIGGLALALLAVKAVIVFGLSRLFRLERHTGIDAALLLAPGSEFTFVIVGLARGLGLLTANVADLALILAALTMALLPLLTKLSARANARLKRPQDDHPLMRETVPENLAARVVIAGFGRVGQTVASLLEAHKISFVAIDMNVDRIASERARGRAVYYGDMTRIALLDRLGLADAQALVVTLDQKSAVDSLVKAAHTAYPGLMIVARARDARHAAHLYAQGVTDAVPETIEASLQLAEAALVDIGIPMGLVIASIHEQRARFRAEIQQAVPEQDVKILTRRRMRDAAPSDDGAQS